MARPPGTEAPEALLQAMDHAIAKRSRLHSVHIGEVERWLTRVIAMNVDDPVELSVSELHLVTKALSDAIDDARDLKRELTVLEDNTGFGRGLL